MARIHGKNGQVAMDPLGGTSYAAVQDLSKFSIDAKRDRQVVTAFGDTNVVRVQGLPDFQGDLNGWWNSVTSPALFDAIFGDVAVALKLTPNSLESGFYFAGPAYLDGSIDVDVNGAVGIGGSWVAAGNWSAVP